jgi:hypothetical protein
MNTIESAPRTKEAAVKTFDRFTIAYVEAMLWSSTDLDGEPLDSKYSVYAFRLSDLLKIREDCAQFQIAYADRLDEAYESDYDSSMAGHDYWLTRERHGAGFWDRGLGSVGKTLTVAAHAEGSCHVYAHKGGLFLG